MHPAYLKLVLCLRGAVRAAEELLRLSPRERVADLEFHLPHVPA